MSFASLTTRGGKALFIGEVLAAAGGIAYLNHKLGAGEIKLFAAADGSGGAPLDGLLGLGGIGFALWRPENRFAKHALALGLGFGSGFAYRTGAAMGDTAAQKAAGHMTAGSQVAQPPAQLASAFAPYAPARQPVAAGVRSIR